MWLKRRTPQNIVIGGAAGRVSAGDRLGRGDRFDRSVPLMLFAIVFIWTPPHFWSLALFANADYQRAGVPMLPVVAGAQGDAAADRALHAAAGAAVAGAVADRLLAASSTALAALVLGVGFLVSVWRVATDRQDASGVSLTNDAPARAAFKYSILYLFALFAALAVDRLAG